MGKGIVFASGERDCFCGVEGRNKIMTAKLKTVQIDRFSNFILCKLLKIAYF